MIGASPQALLLGAKPPESMQQETFSFDTLILILSQTLMSGVESYLRVLFFSLERYNNAGLVIQV
jgi:hypothetical protein